MTAANLPEPEREYLFHEQRNWRFDYAWVAEGIALEFEGGIWMKTKTGRSKGHAHPKRFLKDCEKYNEAALYGWRVLRVTPTFAIAAWATCSANGKAGCRPSASLTRLNATPS
jgi:hypothetical protein